MSPDTRAVSRRGTSGKRVDGAGANVVAIAIAIASAIQRPGTDIKASWLPSTASEPSPCMRFKVR
jgi:hypothetical protein